MIQIKPIQLGLPKKEATQLLVRPIINSTTDTSCNTYYEVLTENNEVLANGNLPISEEQYEEWADDNSYIEDIVLNELELERL
jgi:hypothetical protein